MQWSVWRMTGTPYSSASWRTCKAPATQPATDALSGSPADTALPARNWPPPRENWTIMGPPNLAAASMHALIPHDDTAFTAGIAKPFSFA